MTTKHAVILPEVIKLDENSCGYFCLQLLLILSMNIYENSTQRNSKFRRWIDNTTNKNNRNFILINSFTKQKARKQVFVPLHFYRLFVI